MDDQSEASAESVLDSQGDDDEDISVEEQKQEIIIEEKPLEESAPCEDPLLNMVPLAQFEELQLIISDLSRRLQNAQHTVETQRRVAKANMAQANFFRKRISDISGTLKMETQKNVNNERKIVKERELKRYDEDKAKLTKLHEELRLSLLDHAVSGVRKEPISITKLRTSIEKMEYKLDSQRKILEHLVQFEKMSEELCDAAQKGQLETCFTLLKYGADVNGCDSSGHMPIHYACSGGFSDIVQLLIEFGADTSCYLTGIAALEIAARYGQRHIIEILSKFDVDMDERGVSGRPALISAVSAGYLECAEELLKCGCDVNGKDLEGNTPLHYAAAMSISEHLDRSDDQQRVNAASPSKRVIQVDLSKSLKASRLKQAVQDMRALDLHASTYEFNKSCQNLSASLLKLLLRHGADASIINVEGYTPLQCAFRATNTVAIDILGGRVNMNAEGPLSTTGVDLEKSYSQDSWGNAGQTPMIANLQRSSSVMDRNNPDEVRSMVSSVTYHGL